MEYQPGEKTGAGYLALPPSGSGPGVLVLHAWWGLNEFFVELCERLAREGYVALAPDFYGGAVATSIEEAEKLNGSVAPDAAGKIALEALDSLRQHPAVQRDTVATLGCSMGGWWCLQLATLRPEQIIASVLFYGVGEADFAASRCAYLGHFAENDVWDSVEDACNMVEGIRAAGRDVTFYVYPGVGHWFFESNQPEAYNPEAAQLAWERTLAFLNQHLPLTTAK